MKKFLLLFCLLLVSFQANSQNTRFIYCELIAHAYPLSKNPTIEIDLGQSLSVWNSKNRRIVDEKGRKIDFNSIIDAMNYMGDRGWEFVQAYTVMDSTTSVVHWVLKKDITDYTDEEIEAIYDSIKLNK